MNEHERKTLNRQGLGLLILTFCLVLCAILLLLIPQSVGSGVMDGLKSCYQILIPSLFPFMVLSTFMMESGAGVLLARLLSPITTHLFHLPRASGSVLLMSFIGGYPTGARGIATLYQNGDITELEARRMFFSCINAGPAFIIAAVGTGLFGSPTAGLVLYLAHVFASLTAGFFAGLGKRPSAPAPGKVQKHKPLSVAFVDSVSSASTGMIALCAFVVLFSGGITLLRHISLPQNMAAMINGFTGAPKEGVEALITIILEVTAGCKEAVTVAGKGGFLLAAFALSFAGLCVYSQLLSILTKAGVPTKGLFLSRVIHGLLTVAFAWALLFLIPGAAPTYAITGKPAPVLSASVPACISLLFLCCLLLSGRRKKKGI